MFIEKGFNDFLAKPIDVSKLDEILDRWIPKEKRESGNTANGQSAPAKTPSGAIQGIDMAKGVAMTGGTMALYRQVLSLFRKDAEDRLPLLQTAPEPDALGSFITQVHALKSASASLGADDISAKAAALEAAGKAGDTAFIEKKLPAFARQLAGLVAEIRAWEEENYPEKPADPAGTRGITPPSRARSDLRELAEALKNEEAGDIDSILERLAQMPLDAAVKTALEKISDDVLMADFDGALKKIDEVLRA